MSGNTIIVGAPLADSDVEKIPAPPMFSYARVRDGGNRQNSVPGTLKKPISLGPVLPLAAASRSLAPKPRDEGAPGSGASYSFVRVDGRWEERAKVLPRDPGQKVNYGEWVAISGNAVVVSSHKRGQCRTGVSPRCCGVHLR